MLKCTCDSCGITKTKFVKNTQEGGGIDIHKAIGRLPKPKKGFTLPGHYYTGPYNPLDEQLKYDPETGQILEYYQKQQEQLTWLQLNMTSIIVFAKMIKSVRTKQIGKWLKH